MPKKRRRPRLAACRPRPNPATGPNQVWAHDFVFDACANGQKLKCLTIIDEWTKESLAIDVAGSIRSREAIILIEAWRRSYNEVRPHSSIGNSTPAAFRRQNEATLTQVYGEAVLH